MRSRVRVKTGVRIYNDKMQATPCAATMPGLLLEKMVWSRKGRKEIMSSVSQSESPEDLKKIYSARFSGQADYRNKVWQILTSQFFSRWIKPADTVLDLGCGYGEFSNNVKAAKKYAMDLNPSARDQVSADVEMLEQDCSLPWPLPENSLDIVFTSNFFEHLRTKQALQSTLAEAYRCLKPGGRLIALGPNIKFLPGNYWDFFDHYLALTELSLSEVMTMTGYSVEAIPRFLPYTMSQGSQPPLWTLRLYLKVPLLWKFFGHQFLVIGQKAGN
jgi:SAM-dependent methyltransferase